MFGFGTNVRTRFVGMIVWPREIECKARSPVFDRSFRILSTICTSAFFALSPRESLGWSEVADNLSREDCEFIAQYDLGNEYSFASDFAFMAHMVDIGDGCSNCVIDFRRRTLDFSVSVFGAEVVSDQENLVEAIVRYIDFVNGQTPLRAAAMSFDKVDFGSGGHVSYFFISNRNFERIRRMFRGRPRMLQLLDMVTNPGSNCLLTEPEWTENNEVALVFVNAEDFGASQEITACVLEEGFNALGLRADPQGDDALFSDERWRGFSPWSPGIVDYGYRDQLMARLLFRDFLTNGQSFSETRRGVSVYIEANCSNAGWVREND